MRILLLGSNGQLGWELQRTLAPLGEVITRDFPELDLAQEDAARQIVRQANPQVIVNASAYTAVDQAEGEQSLAYAVNSRAPGVLAAEARSLRAALVHYSTDYVFDGRKGSPYVETDPPQPVNVYGASKLAGEKAIVEAGGAYLILRTSWVFSLRRDSFVTKVLQWSRQQTSLRVVADQIGSPTWARMLAEVTAQLLARAGAHPQEWIDERKGLYHLAGSGAASRLEWAQAILRLDSRREEQVVREVLPARTAEFPTPAKRPQYSALNCDHFMDVFDLHLPHWEEALKLAMGAG